MQKALRSNRVVTPHGIRPASILIELGRIAGVEAYGIETDFEVIDVGDSYVLPGIVVTHTGVNGDFPAATRNAAAEGVTCLIELPFSNQPATSTVRLLNARRAAMDSNCFVDYSFWGAAVPGNVDDLFPLALAGVPGFACVLASSNPDRSGAVPEADLQRLMPVIAKTGLPLLVYNNGQSVELLIDLCEEFDCRVHIVQLTTGETLAPLESARSKKLPLTVEIGPQSPDALWSALAKGTVDFVSGEDGISAVWPGATRRGFAMADVVRWMCERPAELAGLQLRKGHIAPGFDADLVIFESEVKMTFLRGELVFNSGQLSDDPLGTDCMPS